MALVLPFLVVVVLGIVEFGYYIYTYSELENATRRASERASKTPPLNASNANDACALLAKDDALNNVVLSALKREHITVSYPSGNARKVGDQVEVRVAYTGDFLTPIGQSFLGGKLKFDFVSRRTITSLDPPRGYNPDCTQQ